MARVFITGSSDGLGLMAAKLLVEWGHQVTLHARNDQRVDDARRAMPQAEAVAVGDLSSIAQMRQVAKQANALGKYHAVIHNVGVGIANRIASRPPMVCRMSSRSTCSRPICLRR
jgi:NAD(P)-dependent dehydrogenase (short-subunit alcohol dehydrogenase family)